jgi:hypothetical protein
MRSRSNQESRKAGEGRSRAIRGFLASSLLGFWESGNLAERLRIMSSDRIDCIIRVNPCYPWSRIPQSGDVLTARRAARNRKCFRGVLTTESTDHHGSNSTGSRIGFEPWAAAALRLNDLRDRQDAARHRRELSLSLQDLVVTPALNMMASCYNPAPFYRAVRVFRG